MVLRENNLYLKYFFTQKYTPEYDVFVNTLLKNVKSKLTNSMLRIFVMG
jgi:hypothetical protein